MGELGKGPVTEQFTSFLDAPNEAKINSGTNGTCPWDGGSPEVGVSCRIVLCLLVFALSN